MLFVAIHPTIPETRNCVLIIFYFVLFDWAKIILNAKNPTKIVFL